MKQPLKFHLPAALAAFIQAQAQADEEQCGLLIGRECEEGALIDEALAAPNVAQDPSNSFEIDPATRLKAQRLARRQGRVVLGLYHTHPKGKVIPSKRDHAGAVQELGLVWVIASKSEVAIYCATQDGLVAIQPQ